MDEFEKKVIERIIRAADTQSEARKRSVFNHTMKAKDPEKMLNKHQERLQDQGRTLVEK